VKFSSLPLKQGKENEQAEEGKYQSTFWGWRCGSSGRVLAEVPSNYKASFSAKAQHPCLHAVFFCGCSSLLTLPD
jgi:hypothetical protein